MNTLAPPPARAVLTAATLVSVLSTGIFAQQSRDIRAERVVIDDDNGNTITLQTPQGGLVPMSGDYTVTFPEPSVAGTEVLLRDPPAGANNQSVNGSFTVSDTARADRIEAGIVAGTPSSNVRLQSDGSVVVELDHDDDGTRSSFAIESNGAAVPDLFRVTETGLTDITSSSSTGGLRIANTNAGGTTSILELSDGGSVQFVVERNGDAALAGSFSVGRYAVLERESQTDLSGGETLSPGTSHALVGGDGEAVTLDRTTAVTDGSGVGQLLVLIGISDEEAVTIPDGANVQLDSGADRTLGGNDVLTLLWTGTDWVETSYADN